MLPRAEGWIVLTVTLTQSRKNHSGKRVSVRDRVDWVHPWACLWGTVLSVGISSLKVGLFD